MNCRTSFGWAKCIVAAALPLMTLLPEVASAQSCFAAMPLQNLLITSNYGVRKHPKLAGVTRLHEGADLRAAKFTKVFAAESGMVQVSKYSSSAGNYIAILGPAGRVTRYLHNERLYVKTGENVSAGQQIADSGNTGEASAAPHLHFEVRLNGSQPVDPRPYLCNPSEKPGSGPDPTLNPGAPAVGTPAATPITNGVPNNDYPPMGPTPGAAVAVPQLSSMPNYDNMSTQEFLAAESARRFSNPQWMRDIQDPLDLLRHHPDASIRTQAEELPVGNMKPMLLKEIIFMLSLRNFYELEKRERRERIEQMLATDLADRITDYNGSVLEALRRSALATK